MVYNYIPLSDDTIIIADSEEEVNGFAGHDTAVFSGNRSEYIFTAISDRWLSVTGSDRVHVLSGMETYRFADGDYAWDFIADKLDRSHDDPAGTFSLFAQDGFVGAIGGNGKVFGTTGFQSINVLRSHGTITFDASFNRGGDEIGLPSGWDHFSGHMEGSVAVLSDGIGTYNIPVGSTPLPIWAGDQQIHLNYSIDWRAPMIGGVILNSTPKSLIGTDVPGPNRDAAPQQGATVFLSDEAEILVGGNYNIFGTVGDQHIVWLSGNIQLDASFNRGGDRLTVDATAEELTAHVSGANAVLTWGDSKAFIPIGGQGMEIVFDVAGSDASDVRLLRYDADSKQVLLGDQAINTGTPPIMEAHSAATFVIG